MAESVKMISMPTSVFPNIDKSNIRPGGGGVLEDTGIFSPRFFKECACIERPAVKKKLEAHHIVGTGQFGNQ